MTHPILATRRPSIRLHLFARLTLLALAALWVESVLPEFDTAIGAHDFVLWRAFMILVYLMLSWWIMRQAMRPLERLGKHLDNRGAHDHRLLSEEQPAELLPLVASLNRLLQQQQESVDQQRKFLADASHQLRTPFAVLRTQLQGAMSGQLNVQETLPKMLRTVDRSNELIGQLLSLAKVEQLVRRADWQDVNLDQIARDVVLEFAPLIARKKLDFSLEAVPVCFQTNAWLLGELVRNLMSNAVRHSPKGSALGLVVRVLRHEAEFLIWDNAGGLDEAVRERLFEPFESSASGTGVGLGLSICRQIAQSMNASVELFNRVQEGRVVGVDAVVRWPFVAPQLAVDAVVRGEAVA